MVNFEVASFRSFREFLKRSFCDGEVSDGSGGINTICSRLKAADDVISGKDVVDTFKYYVCVNLCIVIFSSFREYLNQPLMQCVDDG